MFSIDGKKVRFMHGLW